MNSRNLGILCLTAVLLLAPGHLRAETRFTYQGRLGSAGQPADGAHDFAFRLFDAETSGGQVGTEQAVSSLDVDQGVFSVQLDFGDAPFNAAPRWLEIRVRASGGGAYTTLSPRQRIGAAPFAIETLFVAPGAVDTIALQDNAVTSQKIADGNIFTDDLANFAVGTAKLSNQAATRLKIADDAIGTSQIENNTVSSADIRDGTIKAVDLGTGLYRTKADLYEVTGPGMNLLSLPQSETASCADADDLPITGGCRVGAPARYVATSVADSHWTSDTEAASVTCNGINVHPTNPSSNPVMLQAYILCVAVP